MTTKNKLVMSALALVLSTAAARRATAANATDNVAPTTVVATPAKNDSGVSADPNADRAFILPTAMTQPGGSATYNNYELVLHGLTYGITDRVQVTATVLSPIVKDIPFVGMGAVKWRFLATPRFHMALQGSFGLAHASMTGASATGYTLGGGAFATACLREDCSSILSASATVQRFFDGHGTAGNVIIYGGSLVHGVGQHVKLLAEVTSVASSEQGGGYDNIPGALVGYGARILSSSIAGDIGFVRPMGDGTNEFLLGLPFVNVSYRWQ